MSITQKLTSYRADWIDVAFIKIAVIAAALLFAKLWEPILSLEWYWYVMVLVVAAIKPLRTFYNTRPQ